jgi:hypothetical protein
MEIFPIEKKKAAEPSAAQIEYFMFSLRLAASMHYGQFPAIGRSSGRSSPPDDHQWVCRAGFW